MLTCELELAFGSAVITSIAQGLLHLTSQNLCPNETENILEVL